MGSEPLPMLRLKFCLIAGMLLCCPVFALAAPMQTPASPTMSKPSRPDTPVAVGHWSARWQRGGLFLDWDGIPLVRGGNVQVFSPDYKRGYYGSGANPPTPTVDLLPDGGRAYTTVYHYAADGNTFDATQRIEIHPPNQVTFTLTARWNGATPALLEWNPARLWAYGLLGATWQAELVSGSGPTGRVGLRPLPTAGFANRLSPPWVNFTLRDTPLGDISLTAPRPASATPLPSDANTPVPPPMPDETVSPVLIDGREDPFLKDEKRFWLGYMGVPLPPGQEVTRTLTLTLSEKKGQATEGRKKSDSSAIQALKSQIHSLDVARRPFPPLRDSAGQPVIIPQPKRIDWVDTDCALLPAATYALDNPAEPGKAMLDPRLAAALADFARDLNTLAGTHLTPVQGRGSLLSVTTSPARAADWFGPNADLPTHAEGYKLRVDKRGILLYGCDMAGAFYGLQTLRQLLRHDSANQPVFAGADIADWPSLTFRGAHIFVGKSALPFHKKLIERIFSRYKMNALVVESEYVKWKSHPEIQVPFSMEPDDLRAEVAFARQHFMEPIPLVNTLGHSEWIFKNGQHLDLAEDVHSPHAYDASNPDTYKFIFDILSETVDIFHPRYFHIGHDEVHVPSYDAFGKYPARPENIAKGATRLFLDDTNKLAAWLKERGIRPLMWGDMALHDSEGDPNAALTLTAANAPTLADAQAIRAGLPREAVIADWRYEPGNEARNGLALFRSAGFDTLGAAWFQPENIRGWALQAVANHALGTLQTTWAGYDSNERILDSELKQFTAYILAAEYAWSAAEVDEKGKGEDKKTGNQENKEKEGHAGTAQTLKEKNPHPSGLPYEAADVFARAYRDTPAINTPQPGWSVDLRDAANVVLHAQGTDVLPLAAYPHASTGGETQSKVETLNHKTELSPEQFPTVADIMLRLTGPEPGGIMLSGRLNPTELRMPDSAAPASPVAYPQAVHLTIDRTARTLAFLAATGYGVERGTVVATYTVVYADGKRVSIPLRYGQEIFALDDMTPNAMLSTSALSWPLVSGSSHSENGNAPMAQPSSPDIVPPSSTAQSPTVNVQSLTLRLLRWTNPRPDVPIAAIEFRAENPLAAPILFAITGAQ